MQVYTTACPRNCYSTCSLKVYVDRNRICRIEGNPDNQATPRGPCLRGLSYIEREYSNDRIVTPLKRNPSGQGFESITWGEALDTISAKLKYLKETHGPQCVLFYSGSGTKGLLNAVAGEFWKLFGGYTTTYGDLCWPAGLEATRLTLGENKHNAPWDIANARLIILWGKNPAETNVQQMRSIDQAIEKGARLVVIDPRRTLSADRAELLIQPRPGTDGALALGIGRCLINDFGVDQAFIDQHVLGFPEYRELVAAYPLEKTAAITDVPAACIRKLAQWISEHPPVSLCAGFGMQRYSNSGQTMRAMIALMAITGNIGKPGAGWIYANLQSAIFSKINDPIAFYPPEQSDGIARVSISTACLGRDMLAQKDPPLKMIWVERGNPVTQNPDTHTVLKAFRSLEFRVVVDQFFTDTTLEADIILPAKTLFEQSDVIGAYWHPYIQLKQKIVQPLGQVKPESEIYWLLARRLGFAAQELEGKIPGPSDREVEAFLENKLKPFPGLTLERLRQGPLLAPGTQEIAFADLAFKTPSGKIELLCREAQTRWGLNPLPAFNEPRESLKSSHPEKREYALYFLTPNSKNRTHSQFNNLRLIRQFSPKPFLVLNPDDALERGIQQGDRVRIFNERGSLAAEACLDFSLKQGCVCMTNGWWITDGGTVNFLSQAGETDMGHGAAFHDNLVQVEKAMEHRG